jgi:hypothetical protein
MARKKVPPHRHRYVKLGEAKYCRGCGTLTFKNKAGETVKLPPITIG